MSDNHTDFDFDQANAEEVFVTDEELSVESPEVSEEFLIPEQELEGEESKVLVPWEELPAPLEIINELRKLDGLLQYTRCSLVEKKINLAQAEIALADRTSEFITQSMEKGMKIGANPEERTAVLRKACKKQYEQIAFQQGLVDTYAARQASIQDSMKFWYTVLSIVSPKVQQVVQIKSWTGEEA